jgi:exopolysaccharide production protein ExoQ
MPPWIASFIFAIGIAGLFILNRDREVRTSKALWLPVFWLLIAGSRPVSVWLQMEPPSSPDQYLEGSPLDRTVFLGLLAAGVLVLIARQKTVARFLRANGLFLLFLFYCAASITWSDYPEVAFKRWIKFFGDFVMVLIVLTDLNQLGAIKRVLARVGFLLLPLSVLFIKYYPELGRAYAPHWEGTAFYVGVASDKNMLGMTCLVFGLGSVWCSLQQLQSHERTRRIRTLIAHGTILAVVVWLFRMANSMTSLSCFLMASTLLVATSPQRLARKPWLVHLLMVMMLSLSVFALFFNVGSGLLENLGRDRTLTGRTELWEQVVELTPNPILGTGFESFWLGQRLEKLWRIYWWHPNESHNGYLEVYLNLGWIGLGLLVMMLVTGYRSVIRLLSWDPEVGGLSLAYFFVGVAYNFTEAAIKTTSLVWIAFALAITLIPQPLSTNQQSLNENDALRSASDPAIAMIPRTSQPIAIAPRKLF